MTPGFIAQRFPRRYAHTIEDCVAAGSVLTVAEATAALSSAKRRRLLRWTWAERPSVCLVAGRMGASRRWWFQCPSCQRRCEALYKPPSDPGREWSCRICAGVTYGSRRHGRRHPARQVPTPRQAIIARRRDEQELRLLNAWAASDPRWAARRDAVREQMARAIAQRDVEAAQAAAWLREQLRRPDRMDRPTIKDQFCGAGVLETLRRLNTAPIDSADHWQ
jgi:hypothetical protein